MVLPFESEYAQMIVIFRQAHDAVVGDVAEQEIAPGREIDRTFHPPESGSDALDGIGAGERREADGT